MPTPNKGRISRLGTIASTICGKSWGLIEIDGSLKCAVVHCLEVLGASFLSAHFMDANVTLWCASPRFESGVKDLQRSIREIASSAILTL